MATGVVERFGGEVPHKMSDLVTLPGVGRKTANVLRSVALDEPGLPVDTHVGRLAGRLGLTTQTDPVKVELALNPMVPAKERGLFSLRRSEEHTSELQSLMRISYAVSCLNKKTYH